MSEAKDRKELLSEEECCARLQAMADALHVVGGKWRLQLIVALLPGGRRFSDLKRLVVGISARVLSAELKVLEINGLVCRQVDAWHPAAVEYELSAYAQTLTPVVDALGDWGAAHRAASKKKVGVSGSIGKQPT